VKLNRKVPFVMSELAANGQQQKGKDGRQFEPIPPYRGEDADPEIKLHEWPPLDDCLKANRTNAG